MRQVLTSHCSLGLMEKEKTTENVKLIGTWFYSVLCLVSSHLSLPYKQEKQEEKKVENCFCEK